MAAVLWYGEGELSVWLARGALERVGHLVLLIAAGVASYFVALTLMGLRVWRLAKPGGA
jgi:peptidoglycan biosynthesis protein MviN/MurJ (putative lipid II flippase)